MWLGLRDWVPTWGNHQESSLILSARCRNQNISLNHGNHPPELQAGTIFGRQRSRECDQEQLVPIESFSASSFRLSKAPGMALGYIVPTNRRLPRMNQESPTARP